MDIPTDFFVLSTLFFIGVSIIAAIRANKDRHRVNYVGVGLCLLGAIWSILIVYDQVSFAGFVWVSAMIISVIMLPELAKHQDEKMRTVDVESPLRLVDFFSNTQDGWLKLAYRYGAGVVTALYVLQALVIGVVLFSVLHHIYGISFGFIYPFLTMSILLTTYRFYRQIKRVLSPELEAVNKQ